MKKIAALLLSALLIGCTAACSAEKGGNAVQTTAAASAAPTEAVTTKSVNIKEHMDKVLRDCAYKGIVSVTRNGEVVYQSATGEDELGDPLTLDSTMYIGSVSKQFCAASVMLLRDRGKLSVDDTLDKYFPEYEAGKKLTIKNLLTMRSGILDMVNEGLVSDISSDKTEEENVEAIKEWIFGNDLKFEPDSSYAYSNSNFFLLGNIVEQVSGKSYIEFVRENIFEPLGMQHSGFVDEVAENPDWIIGLDSESDAIEENVPGLTKGAGDIISNAPDMEKWMTGLKSGKLLSRETFREMTTDYSPDYAMQYGYGLMGIFNGAFGHGGTIANYTAVDYIDEKTGYQIFAVNNISYKDAAGLPRLLLTDII